jgi:hypothetical protein
MTPVEVLKQNLKEETYDYKEIMAYVDRSFFRFIRRKMNECGNSGFVILVRNHISVQVQ